MARRSFVYPFIHSVLVALVVTGCASAKRSVTFSSQETGSSLALVPADNPEGTGTPLSNPVTLTSDKIQGKAIRVTATGKSPEFWYLPGESRRRLEIKVKSLSTCTREGSQEINRNRPVRLLMKAYQALSSEDFKLARELAKKASDIDATLAAPHIISGLSYLNESNKEEARVAFNKARALDPEDTEISELLKASQ